MVFKVVKNAVEGGARAGRLALPKRQPADTPNFFGLTSRGVLPHITPDNLNKHTRLAGTYMALEDCKLRFNSVVAEYMADRSCIVVETSQQRATPAIYNITDKTRDALQAFTAMPSSVATVLGARRHPAVTAPMGNGKDHISISTSMGFRKLQNKAYAQAIDTLKPDIAIPLADLTFGYEEAKQKIPTTKRQYRMVDRTEEWLAQFFNILGVGEEQKPADTHVFAPLLPVPYPIQWDYLNRLAQDHIGRLSGLAVYDTDILPDLRDYAPLQSLPRLSLDFLVSPQEILRQVQLGIDIFTVPFINTASDAGIALSFSFPSSPATEKVMPLGINMWSEEHQVSLEPLREGCGCYACTKHHRAYLQHLLSAKEMLGWTLLQIHNHQVVSDFFTGIRKAIVTEPSNFEENVQLFLRTYESELPKGTGQRPRARGYHFKSEGGQPKINQPAWGKLEAENGETGDPTMVAEMAGLAVTGAAGEGAETPVVPEVDSEELNKKGFAEVDK